MKIRAFHELRRIWVSITLVIFLCTFSACGTIISLTVEKSLDSKQERPLIYSGIRWDLNAVENLGPLVILDMPLSVVLDTVLLPLTIPWALIELSSAEKETKPEPQPATTKTEPKKGD